MSNRDDSRVGINSESPRGISIRDGISDFSVDSRVFVFSTDFRDWVPDISALVDFSSDLVSSEIRMHVVSVGYTDCNLYGT